MKAIHLLYAVFFSALTSLGHFYRSYLYFNSNFFEDFVKIQYAGLLISFLNIIVFWYIRKLVIHFEIKSIKTMANIAFGLTILLFIGDLSSMFGNLIVFSTIQNLSKFISLLYIVFYVRLIVTKVKHVRWLKIYAWVALILAASKILFTNFYAMMSGIVQPLSLVMAVLSLIATVVLPVVFYLEYKRLNIDEHDENEVLDNYLR